jgi:hypothetical protein
MPVSPVTAKSQLRSGEWNSESRVMERGLPCPTE